MKTNHSENKMSNRSLEDLSPSARLAFIQEAKRKHFYFFVQGAFGALHPGQTFLHSPHVECMCFELDRVAKRKNRKLMLNMPPRHFKSFCASIAFPAYVLGHDPSLEIMIATYSNNLGAELSNELRRLIATPYYKNLFPEVALTKNTEDVVKTSQGGGRYSVTPERPNTGIGADIIIVDDIVNNAEVFSARKRETIRQFFENALYSRQNDKKTSRMIVAQQRQHEEDFAARIHEMGSFKVLALKSEAEEDEEFPLYFGRSYKRKPKDILCPELEPRETLDEIRCDIGHYAFKAQYQQNPVPADGTIIRMDKLHYYSEPLELSECGCVVQSWDTASAIELHNDYSVCTTWGFREDHWYLLDVTRERLAYADLKARVIGLKRQWGADHVIVEVADSGRQIWSELGRDFGWIKPVKPRISKIQRASDQTGKLEGGSVLIPSFALPWRETYMNELRAFPHGKHDDQVDSTVHFLGYISGRRAFEPNRPAGQRRNIKRKPGRRKPFREQL